MGWAGREEKGAGLRVRDSRWQREAGLAGAATGAGAGGRGARDGHTVSSFVPSGNVPSTWTSATMSATPACTCRRPRSCLPVSIRVETAVPSRIISSIWVAISAVASGAFSRTPRERRRCATNPTCASCRWSSSRGDRCMHRACGVDTVRLKPRRRRLARSIFAAARSSRRRRLGQRGGSSGQRECVQVGMHAPHSQPHTDRSHTPHASQSRVVAEYRPAVVSECSCHTVNQPTLAHVAL